MQKNTLTVFYWQQMALGLCITYIFFSFNTIYLSDLIVLKYDSR